MKPSTLARYAHIWDSHTSTPGTIDDTAARLGVSRSLVVTALRTHERVTLGVEPEPRAPSTQRRPRKRGRSPRACVGCGTMWTPAPRIGRPSHHCDRCRFDLPEVNP